LFADGVAQTLLRSLAQHGIAVQIDEQWRNLADQVTLMIDGLQWQINIYAVNSFTELLVVSMFLVCFLAGFLCANLRISNNKKPAGLSTVLLEARCIVIQPMALDLKSVSIQWPDVAFATNIAPAPAMSDEVVEPEPITTAFVKSPPKVLDAERVI